jgi:hypothetical protein
MASSSKKTTAASSLARISEMVHTNIMSVNNSKLFAGLVVICLNVSSKFVNLNLSKTTELYLKNTFSRQVLIFAMAWMATRDIYTAMFVTLLFVIFADFLFNENSSLCCFSPAFKEYYMSLDEANKANAPTGPAAASSTSGGTTGISAAGGVSSSAAGPPSSTTSSTVNTIANISADEIKKSIAILEKVKEMQLLKEQPNYMQKYSSF